MKVLVPVGCRSDEGLSAPIIKRLKEDPYFKVKIIKLVAGDFEKSYMSCNIFLDNPEKYDLVLCTGDRIEMTAAACCAFHNGIPIAHYGAGITNNLSCLDDVNRHCITLWSDIQFCEDSQSYLVTQRIRGILEDWKPNAHIVGITHLDDLEIDESLVPRRRMCKGCEIQVDCSEPNGVGCVEAYDLILINGIKETTKGMMEFDNNVHEASYNSKNKQIWIGGNPDTHFKPNVSNYYKNLPRPQFLGLLKNCTRYITNSSSAYYEAPKWLKPEQIILIGKRNKERSTPKKLEIGASDKIVKILREWKRE